MGRILNSVKRFFLTNKPTESLLIRVNRLSKRNPLFRVIPTNNLYRKGTFRNVVRNGVVYELDISDYQEWMVYFEQKGDAPFNIENYLREDAIIFDIGANIGQTSLTMWKSLKHCRIYSFEPYPETYQKMLKNISLNNARKSIIPVDIALGSKEEEVAMFQHCEVNSGSNTIVFDDLSNKSGLKKIRMMSLDQYVNNAGLERMDFIKIDVEGFEYEVLCGAVETLAKWKPSLFVEIDDNNLSEHGSSVNQVIEKLKEMGYDIRKHQTGKPVSQDEKDVHFDVICTPLGNKPILKQSPEQI
ncbi:MAG TPA: FkbM family methyltransferase [Chitinophagaceae bacterium]